MGGGEAIKKIYMKACDPPVIYLGVWIWKNIFLHPGRSFNWTGKHLGDSSCRCRRELCQRIPTVRASFGRTWSDCAGGEEKDGVLVHSESVDRNAPSERSVGFRLYLGS